MRTGIRAGFALVGLAVSAQAATPPKATAGNLSAYVGKYPYDVVGGYRFFDNPKVKAAVAKAIGKARIQTTIRAEEGAVNVPIVRVGKGRILAWGGAKRAEDVHNWAVVISPDGSKPEVCVYEGLGAENDTPSSRWFEPGEPSIFKLGTCPSSAEDYPPHAIAVG
ncbi:hypothetical protein ACSBM8_09295 [Sphingomonas sp. ASY06-1R]|uniref:hypothetical protein n=1 Tax=Sphingomonas sp. ASY06-1R TaxID=3445771 RepID=UPI003FA2BEEB